MYSKFPPKKGWLSYEIGNIVHGPGSYYLDDESITQRFTGIITHQEAHAKIKELLKMIVKSTHNVATFRSMPQ
jgi:hypothetical protein